MARDGTHTKQSGARLGIGIVVRVRVDVVSVDLAIAVRDNFDTRNTDAIGSQKALVSRDQRIFVSVNDPELLGWSDRRAGARSNQRIVDPASVCRTELEAFAGVDAHRVEEASSNKLETRDEGRGRLDVLLDQRDAIDWHFEFRRNEMLGESGCAQEEFELQDPFHHDCASE